MRFNVIRPGPAYLEAGRAPGGIVLRVYNVPDGTLMLERCLSRMDDLETLAERDSAFVFAVTDECCLVAYDGDTGMRMNLADVLG